MILADTSVWIDHFRRGNAALVEALEREDVLVHPFVIGELACGELKKRREILELLASLPSAIVASDEEALQFIEQRRLMGKGIGYIDVHLLASAALTEGARLWTLDKRLAPFARAVPGSSQRS
ncbi:MAG: type II toxin-antitoxin system VapC family toxin [Thermoanaerobaculia bacterium]